MILRRLSQLTPARRRLDSSLGTGQLDNLDLEELVTSIITRADWSDARQRVAVEVGTGGGRGSTTAIHRALSAQGCRFQLIGYEGHTELAGLASRHWRDASNVRIVNEYFMHRADVDTKVELRVAAADRDAYLPEFAALAEKENFLATDPPGLIDLLFIDSVRYTHLAILSAAATWLSPETVILMEDDIPGYGELAIAESEFELLDVARHEITTHQWPFVEFRLGPNRG